MSIDNIVKEAKEAKLDDRQIEVVKREYYHGIRQYYEKYPEPDFFKFGSAILALHAQRIQAEYVGEAWARKYIREQAAVSRRS